MKPIAGTESLHDRGAFRFRPAVIEDAMLLWEWANEFSTRQNSFTTAEIPWREHLEWFRDKLASQNCRIWILEWENLPVGQIRYEGIGADTARISFSVAAGYRGRQLGTLLLRTTSRLAARELGVHVVQGATLTENLASQRAFLKAGFTLAGHKRIAQRDCMIFNLRCDDEPSRRDDSTDD